MQPQVTFGRGLATNFTAQTTIANNHDDGHRDNLPTQIAKKGVTIGMRLQKPERKADEANLDLTMQNEDLNEEIIADEEGKVNLAFNHDDRS